MAGLLCASLLCALLILPTRAAEVYFTSINDSLERLTAETMPVWSAGVLYVPYTVFDASANDTGVELNIRAAFSRTSNTVSFYTMQQVLTFDLNQGNCYNEVTGELLTGRAITRSGRPYVPVDTVCDFFGLTWTYSTVPTVDQGYLVRIKDETVVLDDALFMKAASDLISRHLREYNQRNEQDATPSTLPTDDTPAQPSAVRLYLALRCPEQGELTPALDVLDEQGTRAVCFFTPQQLTGQDDAVRRLLATGHTVGLICQGETTQESLEQLRQGNEILARVAFTRTVVALAPAQQRQELAQQGWVCWQETLSAQPGQEQSATAFRNGVVLALRGRTRTTYLTIDGGDTAVSALPSLLRRLEEGGFVLSIPVETRL